MAQVALKIPNNIIEMNEFELSQEMKDILDERRMNSTADDYVQWEDVKNQIHFKVPKTSNNKINI